MTELNRPYLRGPQHYQALHQEITTRIQSIESKDIFTIMLTASEKGKVCMDEQEFLINLIFKPNNSGLRLSPEQSQLLLSHVGEILKEIEAEEKLIMSDS